MHRKPKNILLSRRIPLQVHPCGRYRHNTVVFILAKVRQTGGLPGLTSYPVQEFGLKNLRTIHRLDRLTSGLLMFGRNPRKAREMEQQIRNRQVMILLSFSLCFISSFFSTRSCFYVAVKSLSGLLVPLCLMLLSFSLSLLFALRLQFVRLSVYFKSFNRC